MEARAGLDAKCRRGGSQAAVPCQALCPGSVTAPGRVAMAVLPKRAKLGASERTDGAWTETVGAPKRAQRRGFRFAVDFQCKV
ncbi:hypothetical protein GGTG_12428 [Gaeumannomyces tritici R3-111a-1]|uniref:Uncharacterized protein n=1 Tax=Gaeumannomyces tritici (strain R3-111a-1) TaxID=644352 RepID=J3PG02_GAET3|nr:hypothetical protein GGTG_12428 [Gaeumannomyces tritici R3-111a-1]EJT70255.1 hypothetical protein GGTG_12428 [Gaeumannomyces tritici R3-111a-1]